MKNRWIMPALAAALVLTGCGGRRDRDTDSRTETHPEATARREERRDEGLVSDAVENGREMASNAAENGKEMASDLVEDGKELATDLAGDIKEEMHDGDGTYRADERGRVYDNGRHD